MNKQLPTTDTESSQPLNTPRVVEAIGFVVNERPIAIYGIGMRETTNLFIKHFSPSFWEHQLELVSKGPIDSPSHDHVTLVRLALGHAEEHLFSLIFAFLQAPHSPDLWLYQYKHEDLTDLVKKVNAGEKVLSPFDLNAPTWETVARILWPSLEESRYLLTSKILERLANRFTSEFGKGEFNGMKHGMRLSLGGQSISFSPGGSPDVAPSPESFISLGDSKFGCRFWAFEKIPGAKDHYRAKLRMTNWDFQEIGHYLAHTTLLIGNMGAAFRVFSKIDGDCEFRYFSGDAAYEMDPRKITGMIKGEMVVHYDLKKTELLDLEKIRTTYL